MISVLTSILENVYGSLDSGTKERVGTDGTGGDTGSSHRDNNLNFVTDTSHTSVNSEPEPAHSSNSRSDVTSGHNGPFSHGLPAAETGIGQAQQAKGIKSSEEVQELELTVDKVCSDVTVTMHVPTTCTSVSNNDDCSATSMTAVASSTLQTVVGSHPSCTSYMQITSSTGGCTLTAKSTDTPDFGSALTGNLTETSKAAAALVMGHKDMCDKNEERTNRVPEESLNNMDETEDNAASLCPQIQDKSLPLLTKSSGFNLLDMSDDEDFEFLNLAMPEISDVAGVSGSDIQNKEVVTQEIQNPDGTEVINKKKQDCDSETSTEVNKDLSSEETRPDGSGWSKGHAVTDATGKSIEVGDGGLA